MACLLHQQASYHKDDRPYHKRMHTLSKDTPSTITSLSHKDRQTPKRTCPLLQGHCSDIPSLSRTGPPTTMTHLPSQMHTSFPQGHTPSSKDTPTLRRKQNPHTRPWLFPHGHSPCQDFTPPQTMTHPLPQGHTSCNEKASHLKM